MIVVVDIRTTLQRFAKHRSNNRPERTEVGVGSLVTGFVTLMVLGTDLFVVAPLLPLIARDYTIPVGTAGIAVTAFSVAYVIAAPWLGARADRLGRRRLLTIGLLCFAAANVLTGLAPTFAVLIVARVLAGAAAAAVTPSVYALTGQYAPSGRRGGWLAIVGAGLLISLATGAPVGSLTAAATSWHIVFVAIAVLAVLLAVVNRVAWPPGAPSGGAGTAPPGVLTKIRAASVTALWGMSIYVLYTYLAAGLGKTAGLSPGAIAIVLVVYGVGAVLGSLGGGRLADRYSPSKVAAASLLGLAVLHLLVDLVLAIPVAVAVALGLFALVSYACFPAHQARLVAAFPTQSGSILAWNNSALYVGISAGAAIGGAVLSAGFFLLPLIGALTALAGVLVSTRWAIPKQDPHDNPSTASTSS